MVFQFHQGALVLTGWSLLRVVFHNGALIRVLFQFHQGALKRMVSPKVVFHNGALIRVLFQFHQGGLL